MNDHPHTYMLYARVSPKGSDWHAEETSVALQIEEMKAYILRRDPLAEFLIRTDEFKSGKNLNRPGMQAVLCDLEAPEPSWGTLVVWALDRLSRSLADAIPIFEKLRDAGRGFVCVRQDYLSTQGAMARFTLNQTILVAQLEREMTAERVKAKMVWIAEKGKVPAGRLPLGYRRKEGAKNEIEPDPETAPIVRAIFNDYLGQAVSVADLRRRYSKYLYGKNQLYRMLRNPIYIGKVEYDGKVYVGQHEPIIDREVFEKVNALLPGERRAPRPSRQTYKYLLQGLVLCKCGRRMSPYSIKKSGDTRYFYYKCQDQLGCKFAVNAERLDEEVLNQVKRIVLDPEYIRERWDVYRQQKAERENAQRSVIQKSEREIADAERNVQNIDRLFIQGVISPENAAHFNEKLRAARQELELLQERHKVVLNDLAAIHSEDELPAILQQIKEWADLLERSDDWQTKRNLLLTVVKYVKCLDEDGGMELSLVMTKGNKWRSDRGLVITVSFSLPRRGFYRRTRQKYTACNEKYKR